MRWNSTSQSASGLEAEPLLGGARRAVAFDLADPSLEGLLAGLVRDRADLFETDGEDADVLISDRAPSEPGNVRTLRIGADEPGRNAIDSLDPGLVLAAATLVAAGYVIDRQATAPAAFRMPDSLLPHLSARERQVAELLVDGASNKVIARALDISVHTAKFHVTAILDKLGARNRADAVSIILREGLVAL